MLAKPLLSQVLDESLTRNLGDPEACILIEWLVDRAEALGVCEISAQAGVAKLRRRARAIACFVHLWCYRNEWGAAGQLAVAERFYWPLPTEDMDPCELMQTILYWEDRQAERI